MTMADLFEKKMGIAVQRFERGDLIVHLSSDVHDVLVITSSVLIGVSKWFEASLTRWQEPVLAGNACVPTYQLGLTYDADLQSWSLSTGPEKVKPRCNTLTGIPKLYRTQILARTNETNHRDVSEAHRASIQAHKMLFALIFQLRIGFGDISKVAPLIADVLVLAEFYQLMPFLSESIEKTLKMQSNSDGDVIENLAFYLSVSEILQSRVLFEEAMRHFIGSGQYKEKVRGLNPLTSALANTKAGELKDQLADLKRALEVIDLELPAPFLVPDSTRQRGRRQEAIWMARSVFLDWLVTECPGTADIVASAGCTFFSTLYQHGLFDDVSFLGESACRKLREAYHLKSQNATKQVTWGLHEYVRRASRLIDEMQQSKDTPAARTQAIMGPYFTNMAFKEGDMPWEQDEKEESMAYGNNEVDDSSESESPSSYPRVERWLDTYEYPDEQKHEPHAMEYDQEVGWVVATNPLAKPASDTWLKMIGLEHLIGV